MNRIQKLDKIFSILLFIVVPVGLYFAFEADEAVLLGSCRDG